MTNIIKQGKLRADKVKYPDGVGCTVWYPFTVDGENEDVGICFDFSADDIDDFIELLKKVKDVKPEIYVE